MPTLAEQHRQMQGFTTVFTLLRLLTQLMMSYEAAKKRMVLAKKAVAEHRRAYVLVNNRSEGNAPLTIQGLVDDLG